MGDATVIGRLHLLAAKTTLLYCRQALRGAQGHPWSGVGRVGLEPALYQSTSISAEARQALSCCPLHSDVSTTLCFREFWHIKNSLCSVRQTRKEEQHKRNKLGSEILPPNI